MPGTRRALERSSLHVRSFEDATGIKLTSNPKGPKSAVCDVFSRTLQRSNRTRANFLNRVTWYPRLLVMGLVAFALLAMAPPTGAVDDDEEDPGPSSIAMVASRINGSLSSRSTTQTQQHEPNAVATEPARKPCEVRAREANFSWHGDRWMLKSFCFLRC